MSVILFLVEFMPDLVWVLLFFLGITAIVAAQFMRGVPLIMQYRIPLMFTGFFVLMMSVWALGVSSNEAKWKQRLKEVEEQVKKIEAESVELNQQLEKEVAEKKVLAENVRWRGNPPSWPRLRHSAKRRPWHLLARALRGHQVLHRRLPK